MPRTSVVLQVFVASPSDVAEERSILDSVVAELNRTWSGNLGVTFELLKWETHVHPSFNVDPQAVVNSQMPENYDVFLGIFWSRLGTPTGRAESGTVEEFERAYAKFKSTGSVPEIMLYFKDAPLSPSKIDVQQFSALQRFRGSLADKGGLFSTFEDQPGFEASLRAHLSAIAQKFTQDRPGSVNSALPLPEAEVPLASSDEDFGLFDYLDIYGTRTEDMTAAMALINEATVRIGEQLSQRAAELPAGGHQDVHSAKRYIKRAADDLFRYAETLETQVTVLASARQDSLGALSSAIALMADFTVDVPHMESLRSVLFGTIDSISSARTSLIGMRDAAIAIPRLSKDLNKATRIVASNLDNFLAEIDSIESTVINLIEAMERLLDMAHTRSQSASNEQA